MKSVLVKFNDTALNNETSINPNCSNEDIERYFIGKYFDKGVYPAENMQKCIAVEITTTLAPLSMENPLSSQLVAITGDSWNVIDYEMANNPLDQLSTSGPFRHKKTGHIFIVPAKC